MSQEVLKKADQDFLSIKVGDDERAIACIAQRGSEEKPGLFWLNGFKSSMMGTKASSLSHWAHENSYRYTRMDYSGHGASGGEFLDGTITRWLEEVTAVFERATSGPQIIVGSSMGGWLALLMAHALQQKNRLAGMVLIAPAWDMTERLMFNRFSDEAKIALEKHGSFSRPSAYGDDDYVITKKLIKDGRHHLVANLKLHLGCPLHILHGHDDPDVPWQHGQNLMALLPRDDVSFTLVPDGDHRLSRPQDIELLVRTIEEMA